MVSAVDGTRRMPFTTLTGKTNMAGSPWDVEPISTNVTVAPNGVADDAGNDPKPVVAVGATFKDSSALMTFAVNHVSGTGELKVSFNFSVNNNSGIAWSGFAL